MQIVGLKVEGRERPLSVDRAVPGFSWSYAGTEEYCVLQTSYRIRVYSGEEQLAADSPDVWDSGKLSGRAHTSVSYGGVPLRSGGRYYWKVTVKDNYNRMWESEPSWWEMGQLQAGDWKGRWIAAPAASNRVARSDGQGGSNDSDGPNGPDRSLPLLRREFAVGRELRAARMYICGLGHYELRLNGAKVGDRELEPGWTNYDKTCLYSVYDVTEYIRTGRNAVGVMLGNGFYNVAGGRYTKFKGSFGQPKCLAQLELHYADGTREEIVSDDSWLASQGPLVFSCIYGGEDYDAGREQPGWDLPDFAGAADWVRAAVVEPPQGTLRAQSMQPLKVMQRFQPVSVSMPRPGVWLVDFGQNFSGWAEIAVSGSSGSQVVLLPGEKLKQDGTVDQRMTGSPYKWVYTMKGEGVERWRPRFSYYGFRYLQVEGACPCLERAADSKGGEATLLSVEGQMIYPDTAVVGKFECSNPLLNRIHEIINWAMLSNMKSIFTDCPHREKLGWLEQVHLMGPSVMYNYDVESMTAKVMNDIRDAQQPSGMLPTTAPEYVVFRPPWDTFRDSVSWGATYVLSHWQLLNRYGSTAGLREHYGGMRRYADYIASRTANGLVMHGLGDWYDVGEAGPGFAQNTPVPLVETALFYSMISILSQMAAMLGEKEDAAYFDELRTRTEKAFNDAYFNPQTGQYADGSQTANAMPFVLGLVRQEHRRSVLAGLIRDIEARGCHTNSGDVGHRFVLLALWQSGRSDLIYRMAVQTDHPSYGYQVAQGATTLTEAWDGPTVGKSQNHYMLGHIEEWLYLGLGGIACEYDNRGQAFHVTVKPAVVGDLTYAEARLDTPAGRTEVRWERRGAGGIRMQVAIPVNTKALIHVPAAAPDSAREASEEGTAGKARWVGFADRYAIFIAGSGNYTFDSVLEAAAPVPSSAEEEAI